MAVGDALDSRPHFASEELRIVVIVVLPRPVEVHIRTETIKTIDKLSIL